MSSIFDEAKRWIPGGVNSPVRAYRGMGRDPVFVARADGCRVFDRDDRGYVDYVMSYGPHLFGHRFPPIDAAIRDALERGTSFGAPTEAEVRFAARICELVPGIEMVRLVNSGTEATMSAIRLARAATGRERILKFEGCYHGHADAFLVKAGSGALTLGHPDSPGVPAAAAALTTVARFNDPDDVERAFDDHPGEIAAAIVEPIAGNVGCIAGDPDFLARLIEICRDRGALSIFDEVMTGFRVAPGGAQELYGVTPDLTTLGKIIGGGLPVGAYGGRRDLMELIAPAGPVYQAGTLSGNPLAVAAGRAALETLAADGFHAGLEAISARVADAIAAAAADSGCPIALNRVGSMLCPYFSERPVLDLAGAMASDRGRHRRFFNVLIDRGVLTAPSPFEAWFVSSAHDDAAITATYDACRAGFAAALAGD